MFTAVVRKASFGGAATELGTSPAYVSKRVRLLEQDLQVKLLHRTARRVAVTEEGERIFWKIDLESPDQDIYVDALTGEVFNS